MWWQTIPPQVQPDPQADKRLQLGCERRHETSAARSLPATKPRSVLEEGRPGAGDRASRGAGCLNIVAVLRQMPLARWQCLKISGTGVSRTGPNGYVTNLACRSCSALRWLNVSGCDLTLETSQPSAGCEQEQTSPVTRRFPYHPAHHRIRGEVMPLVPYYLGRPAHIWIAAMSPCGPARKAGN